MEELIGHSCSTLHPQKSTLKAPPPLSMKQSTVQAVYTTPTGLHNVTHAQDRWTECERWPPWPRRPLFLPHQQNVFFFFFCMILIIAFKGPHSKFCKILGFCYICSCGIIQRYNIFVRVKAAVGVCQLKKPNTKNL